MNDILNQYTLAYTIDTNMSLDQVKYDEIRKLKLAAIAERKLRRTHIRELKTIKSNLSKDHYKNLKTTDNKDQLEALYQSNLGNILELIEMHKDRIDQLSSLSSKLYELSCKLILTEGKSIYRPVQLNQALNTYVDLLSQGSSQSSLKSILDQLPLLKQGYTLRASLTIILLLDRYYNLPKLDKGYTVLAKDSPLDIAFNQNIPAGKFIDNNDTFDMAHAIKCQHVVSGDEGSCYKDDEFIGVNTWSIVKANYGKCIKCDDSTKSVHISVYQKMVGLNHEHLNLEDLKDLQVDHNALINEYNILKQLSDEIKNN